MTNLTVNGFNNHEEMDSKVIMFKFCIFLQNNLR